jgi:hypothetical protein
MKEINAGFGDVGSPLSFELFHPRGLSEERGHNQSIARLPALVYAKIDHEQIAFVAPP